MKRTFSIILILYFQLWMVFSKTPNTKYWRSFQSEDGPSFESNCYGSRQQSPIDLPKNGIKTQYEDFEYHNYSETPSKYSIINNGHTVKLFQMKDSSFPPFIIGGGLHSIYKFAQLHFHWGNSSTFGSEHTIDEEAFPLELHMVHFNSKYGTNLEEAVQKGNGSFDTLAVLGILFEVQEEDNLAFDEIVKGLSRVKYPEKTTYVAGFPLRNLLPQDKQSFYRYMGSLTTPLCDQIVVWTVYKETVGISERQLEQFRELRARQTKYPLVNTFRSVQSVNGRLVFEVSSSQKGSLVGNSMHLDYLFYIALVISNFV